MKKLLTIIFVFISAYMFGQTSMGNLNMPTSSINFPLAIAPYSYEVTQVDSNLTIVITGSYTTSDNLRDVYSDGNYYVLSGGGGTSYFDLSASGGEISTKAGIDTVTLNAGVIIDTNIKLGAYGTALDISGSYGYSGISDHVLDISTEHPLDAGKAAAIINIISQTTGNNNIDHIAAIQTNIEHTSSGTLDNIYGTYSSIGNSGGNITSLYDFYVNEQAKIGTVTNRYGLYIRPLTTGSSINYAIYTQGATESLFDGNVRFATSVGIGTAMPTSEDLLIRTAAGDDLVFRMYQSGSNYFDFKIPASQTYMTISDISDDMMKFNNNAGIEINYNGLKKFETINEGVNITGSLGINATPSYTLDVNGQTRSAGNTYADSNLYVGDSIHFDGALAFTDPHNATNVMIGDGAGATSATHGGNNTGVGRLALNDLQSGGLGNVAIGDQALENLTIGDFNTAIGFEAMENHSFSENVAVGYRSLENGNSSNNVAVGNNSLNNAGNGHSNVAIGDGAMQVTTGGGHENVAIGREALLSVNGGDGNVAVGYQSGRNWTGSNALFIDNSSTTTPLIFGNFSADSVKIHGELTHNNAFGEMVFSEADTISTATTSWYSPTKWALGDFYATSVVGDTAMVITQNGWYQVNASPSFSHSGTNVLIHYGVFVNDVLETGIQAERTIGATGSQFGSASLSGIIKITNAPDTLQLKVNADKTGNLISNHNNVTAVRIR